MASSITKHDGTVLNHHARRGDAQELGMALEHLVQREGPYGMDRADIILLAKDEAGDTVVLNSTACWISEWPRGADEPDNRVFAKGEAGNAAVRSTSLNHSFVSEAHGAPWKSPPSRASHYSPCCNPPERPRHLDKLQKNLADHIVLLENAWSRRYISVAVGLELTIKRLRIELAVRSRDINQKAKNLIDTIKATHDTLFRTEQRLRAIESQLRPVENLSDALNGVRGRCHWSQRALLRSPLPA